MPEGDIPETEAEVRQLVRDIVVELAPTPEGYSGGESHLVDDLDYHSLALLEMAFALEDEFDLPPIDEPTARAIVTVGHVEDHVVRELMGAGLLAASLDSALR